MGVEGEKLSFVHLHVHSQYSLLEATCKPKSLANTAQKMEMPAVAMTDLGNMFGVIEHYFACNSAGVKPIIGLEVFLAPKSRHVKGEDRDNRQPNTRLVLLAKNYEGYQNLCRISTIGYQEGFYYRPRVDYEVLEQHSEHLIALTGGSFGDVPWTFINKGKDEALEKLKKLKEIYKDNLYLELTRMGLQQNKEVNDFLLECSKEMNIPYVAANDVHYMTKDEQIAQEVLICIGTNKTLQDPERFRLGSDQFYFKTEEEMKALFKDLPEAIENTVKIADQCNVEFQLTDEEGKPIYHLPTYPTKEGRTLKQEIEAIARDGLEQRFKEYVRIGEPVSDEKKQEYFKRLEYELNIIDGMGFNGYFLIVQDFINWSKDHDIPVGPGRGSGAGSLVAYSLFITDLDPMPYNLIFERFLNPERISMPDFDIDFCQENRGRVIDYVTEKYKPESVSQIITYGKLQTRAAIRDVGRVMGMTYGEVDVVSKLVPDILGISLSEAIEKEPRLREMMENDPKINTLMELALKVEGLVRHAGIHAAGVVIADGELVSHAALCRGADGESVVQYDMKHSEKIGLIKFDFLGLKTLTHINDAIKLIEKNRGKKIITTEISLKDPGIYELIAKGDTNGVFQFEGDGITDLIKKAKPDCFEDIVAINALYRPGPMEMIPDYLERKHGRKKVEYIFEELEPILQETYGIVVYQEHVQLIASKIASYSLGEADMLRRAMGKKIAEEMAKQKKRFMKGAVENGYPKDKSEVLFDTMAEFAKYGFNKSHAAAYCVISAQTAWLKHYYPVEFFAALLSTEMSDTDKVVKYVKDAQKHNINVNAPHVNYSEYKFTVKGDEIYFSLGAIKGVGQSAVESIIEARENKPEKKFESLEDFFESVDLRKVNKKTIECLIKAGAFDDFGYNRAELINGYLKFIDRADRVRKDADMGQVSLFSLDESIEEADKVSIDPCADWSRSQKLSYEKEVLGFYLSDHPMNGIDSLAKPWISDEIQNLVTKEKKQATTVVGMISTLKEIITKKGTRMAFAQLEDMTGQTELIIFPDAFSEYEDVLKSEKPILVSGAVEVSDDKSSSKILVESVKSFQDELVRVKKMVFRLPLESQEKLNDIKELISQYPGSTKLSFLMQLDDIKKQVELDLIEPEGVTLSSELLDSIYTLVPNNNTVQLQI